MPIKKTCLHYQDEKSDKVYEVEIVYIAWGLYEVHVSYGRRDSKLKVANKTKTPLNLAKAEKKFDHLVRSKKNQGYQLKSYSVGINKEYLLEVSQGDRQKIIDEIKFLKIDNCLPLIEEKALDKQEYLQGLNLSYLKFINANLEYANLLNTNLKGIDFTGANLQGIYLEGSVIDEETKIDDKYRLLWQLIHFGGENQDFKNVDLSGIEISFDDRYDYESRIKLAGASFENANFENAVLSHFDFTNANLKNANLINVSDPWLQGANLENANLSKSWFDEIYWNDVIAISANFSNVSFEGEFMNLENGDFSYANFHGVWLTGGCFAGANFTGANFSKVKNLDYFLSGMPGRNEISKTLSFAGANFSETELFQFDFRDAFNEDEIKFLNFQRAIFDNANLSQTDFRELNLENVSFRNANLEGAILKNCNLKNVDFTKANLKSANLQGINLDELKSYQGVVVDDKTKVDSQWQDWLKSML